MRCHKINTAATSSHTISLLTSRKHRSLDALVATFVHVAEELLSFSLLGVFRYELKHPSTIPVRNIGHTEEGAPILGGYSVTGLRERRALRSPPLSCLAQPTCHRRPSHKRHHLRPDDLKFSLISERSRWCWRILPQYFINRSFSGKINRFLNIKNFPVFVTT